VFDSDANFWFVSCTEEQMQFMECIWASETVKRTPNFKEEMTRRICGPERQKNGKPEKN
jgi:hypothetical protein